MRLLKNLIGLWLVQECRRDWAKAGRDCDYAALTHAGGAAPTVRFLDQPRRPRFLGPDDMPAKIAAFCRETDQPVRPNQARSCGASWKAWPCSIAGHCRSSNN